MRLGNDFYSIYLVTNDILPHDSSADNAIIVIVNIRCVLVDLLPTSHWVVVCKRWLDSVVEEHRWNHLLLNHLLKGIANGLELEDRVCVSISSPSIALTRLDY